LSGAFAVLAHGVEHCVNVVGAGAEHRLKYGVVRLLQEASKRRIGRRQAE
jgi:hypothetical protein